MNRDFNNQLILALFNFFTVQPNNLKLHGYDLRPHQLRAFLKKQGL